MGSETAPVKSREIKISDNSGISRRRASALRMRGIVLSSYRM